MAQAITWQAHAMTSQAEQYGVPRKNPPACTMASRLRDFKNMNHFVYTGSKIAEKLEDEWKIDMMHDNVDLSRLMVYVKQVKESRKRKNTSSGNKSRKMRRIFQGRVVLKSGISPGWRRDYSTKGSEVHQRVTIVGVTSLDLRETIKLIHLRRDHLSRSLANYMEESVWWALMLVTIVANRVTWWRIVRIWEVEKKERRKLIQMVQVKRIQGGNDSLHSSLRV